MHDRPALLIDLPTSVRGLVYHDDEGEPVIVLNSRLSHEQNRKTYKHECDHIDHGDMFEPTYTEYR